MSRIYGDRWLGTKINFFLIRSINANTCWTSLFKSMSPGPFHPSCKLLLKPISPVLSGFCPTICPWVSEDGFSHATCGNQHMKTILVFQSNHCWNVGTNQSNSSFTRHETFACQVWKRGYSKLYASVNELCNVIDILWVPGMRVEPNHGPYQKNCWRRWRFFQWIGNPFSDLVSACCHNEWTRAVWEKT